MFFLLFYCLLLLFFLRGRGSGALFQRIPDVVTGTMFSLCWFLCLPHFLCVFVVQGGMGMERNSVLLERCLSSVMFLWMNYLLFKGDCRKAETVVIGVTYFYYRTP